MNFIMLKKSHVIASKLSHNFAALQSAVYIHIVISSHKALNMMEQKFDELIDGYLQNKAGVSTHFLNNTLTEQLRKRLELLHMQDELSPAGIGRGISKVYDLQIRSDKIYWIDKTSTDTSELELVNIVEEFISYLNRTCYAGINDYEIHYALYEPGSFYKRHLDQFKNNPGRKFTFIIYLNEDWKDEYGGHLAVYPDGGEEGRLIMPSGGTSVFFKSDELEHDVRPATRPRMSIAGWLKRN